MKYYHGTTYDAGTRILKEGFSHRDTIWTCSNKNVIYLVSEEHDGGPYEDGNYDPQMVPAFNFAVNAAQIAAAHTNQQTDSLIVFEFDIPDDIVNADTSCENMYDCYQIPSKDLDLYINDHTITVKVWQATGAYEPELRIFYLKDLCLNYYTPPQKLEKAIRDLAKVETSWFYDDYLSQYNTPQLIYESFEMPKTLLAI